MPPETDFPLFRGIDLPVVRAFLGDLPEYRYRPGEAIVREGSGNEWLYLVQEGAVTIWRAFDDPRGKVALSSLGAGDTFGEMSVLTGEPVAATLVADEATTIRRFAVEDLPASLREPVFRNLAGTVVGRLSSANDAVLERHRERIRTMETQLSISVFLTKTLVGLALYIFLLPLVQVVKPYLPSDSFISFFFILTYLFISVLIVRQSALPPRDYGVTLEGWPRAAWRGFLLTAPLMAAVLAVKYAMVVSGEGRYALFEPWRAVDASGGAGAGGSVGLLWAGLTVTYLVLSFAQEFIRCAIQGSLAIFYRVTGVRDAWKSILVANVVFAALHTHLSSTFALIVFLPGLFWGWVYRREHSFVAVAVSHSLLGTWALFIVGMPY
jgi:CRP-like cAMP-binding protein